VDVDDDRGTGARASDLLDADGQRDVVHPGTAVARRDQDAHQVQLGRGFNRFHGVTVVAVNLGRDRLHRGFRELAHSRPEG
jgi:hypothetical protein